MANFNAPLRRSRSNRMLGGVVAGLANYFGLDVSLARVLYVAISICSVAFPGILVYILLWIIVPEEEYRETRNETRNTYDNPPQSGPQSGG